MVAPTTVTYGLNTPAALPRAGIAVTAQLTGAGDRNDAVGVVGSPVTVTTGVDGVFTLSLLPNSVYEQLGTYYAVNIAGGPSYSIVVPVSGSVLDLWDLRVDPRTLDPVPATVPPIYLTRAERGATDGVASLGSDGKVPTAQLPIGGGSVPSTRQILTGGLLTGGGDLSADRTITSPAYGSSAGTICQGNDPRLSDARAPLAHTHPQSDVTGLVAALAGKETAGAAAAAVAAHKVESDAHVIGVITGLQAALDAKAPTASPTFTGTVAGVSKAMVGLSNVDNTSDAGKPVSAATQAALDLKAPLASPTFTGTVAGVTKAHVGLSNVDNTSDAGKPVSTATQTALNLKADLASPTFTGTVAGITKTMVGLGNADNTSDADKPISTATQTALDAKATKPRFTTSTTTSGNIQLNTGTNTWGILTGAPTLAIAAAAGDLIELSVQALRQANANIFLDFCVIVSAAVARYMGTLTSTPPGEGNPALYHTALPATGGTWKWVAQAGDISGGNVTAGIAIRNTSGASSLLLASTDNPLQIQLENRGPSN